MSTQLFASLLDEVEEESDEETLRRRLLATGRLIVREGPEAGDLLCTLGLGDGLDKITSNTGSKYSQKNVGLAKEVVSLIVPINRSA